MHLITCYTASVIRAIIVDCFGLLYPDPVAVYRHDGRTPEHVVAALQDIHDRAAVGEVSREEYIIKASRLLSKPAETIIEEFFGNSGRDDEALAFVSSLRPLYKVVLLSNAGDGMVEARFTPDELQRYFDLTVLSNQLKTAKPDPAMYRWACEQLSVATEDALVIDDASDNCEAAQAIGMQAVQYRNRQQALADVQKLLDAERQNVVVSAPTDPIDS
jgi:putative hydrolase of the HAD superfamily